MIVSSYVVGYALIITRNSFAIWVIFCGVFLSL